MTTFTDLGIGPQLIKALELDGIIQPTEIQVQSIPLLMAQNDLIGQSPTGSGKTLAYLLPLFEKIHTDKREMQAFILAPTHELVMQINQEIKKLAGNADMPLSSIAIIGDVNINRQIESLREKPHIIVGSVGRINELVSRKKINTQTIKTIVIDEGDRLLDEDDIHRVKALIKTTMKDRQLVVFAAHIDGTTLSATEELMPEAQVVRISEQHPVNDAIRHVYFVVDSQRDKFELLRKLINAYQPLKAMVFVNNSEDITQVTEKLRYHNLQAQKILGRISKEERQRALESFRSEDVQLLVASDIAARGLDIKGVSHIFSLDLPERAVEYMNRAGRTGRHGSLGVAVSIITKYEIPLIRRFAKELAINFQENYLYQGNIADQPRERSK